mmetsp:Transcript_70482/g.206217  ORF Transcript_70482/g.206217 Transcript_70482/m.206217 type:complete len:210 (+) Transcript_70482:914-1543(+)
MWLYVGLRLPVFSGSRACRILYSGGDWHFHGRLTRGPNRRIDRHLSCRCRSCIGRSQAQLVCSCFGTHLSRFCGRRMERSCHSWCTGSCLNGYPDQGVLDCLQICLCACLGSVCADRGRHIRKLVAGHIGADLAFMYGFERVGRWVQVHWGWIAYLRQRLCCRHCRRCGSLLKVGQACLLRAWRSCGWDRGRIANHGCGCCCVRIPCAI